MNTLTDLPPFDPSAFMHTLPDLPLVEDPFPQSPPHARARRGKRAPIRFKIRSPLQESVEAKPLPHVFVPITPLPLQESVEAKPLPRVFVPITTLALAKRSDADPVRRISGAISPLTIEGRKEAKRIRHESASVVHAHLVRGKAAEAPSLSTLYNFEFNNPFNQSLTVTNQLKLRAQIQLFERNARKTIEPERISIFRAWITAHLLEKLHELSMERVLAELATLNYFLARDHALPPTDTYFLTRRILEIRAEITREEDALAQVDCAAARAALPTGKVHYLIFTLVRMLYLPTDDVNVEGGCIAIKMIVDDPTIATLIGYDFVRHIHIIASRMEEKSRACTKLLLKTKDRPIHERMTKWVLLSLNLSYKRRRVAMKEGIWAALICLFYKTRQPSTIGDCYARSVNHSFKMTDPLFILDMQCEWLITGAINCKGTMVPICPERLVPAAIHVSQKDLYALRVSSEVALQLPTVRASLRAAGLSKRPRTLANKRKSSVGDAMETTLQEAGIDHNSEQAAARAFGNFKRCPMDELLTGILRFIAINTESCPGSKYSLRNFIKNVAEAGGRKALLDPLFLYHLEAELQRTVWLSTNAFATAREPDGTISLDGQRLQLHTPFKGGTSLIAPFVEDCLVISCIDDKGSWNDVHTFSQLRLLLNRAISVAENKLRSGRLAAAHHRAVQQLRDYVASIDFLRQWSAYVATDSEQRISAATVEQASLPFLRHGGAFTIELARTLYPLLIETPVISTSPVMLLEQLTYGLRHHRALISHVETVGLIYLRHACTLPLSECALPVTSGEDFVAWHLRTLALPTQQLLATRMPRPLINKWLDNVATEAERKIFWKKYRRQQEASEVCSYQWCLDNMLNIDPHPRNQVIIRDHFAKIALQIPFAALRFAALSPEISADIERELMIKFKDEVDYPYIFARDVYRMLCSKGIRAPSPHVIETYIVEQMHIPPFIRIFDLNWMGAARETPTHLYGAIAPHLGSLDKALTLFTLEENAAVIVPVFDPYKALTLYNLFSFN
ncbi:MAG: hypothetical protein ACKVOH_04625 [Chlamydiales bacterium]